MDLSAQLHDSNFWVLMSAIVFAIVVYKKGRVPLMAFLDARADAIRAELEQAEKLRIEAQNLLADIQQKHRDAVATSEKIIASAKDTALRLQSDAAAKLEETQKRREAQLLDRIARAEAAAVQELRAQAADIAAKSAEAILHDALAKKGGKIVDEAISELAAKAN